MPYNKQRDGVYCGLINEKRKSGFYWVEHDGEMIVARYYGDGMSDAWLIPGDEFTYNDGYFDKIIEDQICYE